MKQRMRFSRAFRTYSLALASMCIALAGALMVQPAQASLTPVDSGITLVSLSVSNPLPYLVHDWDGEAGEKTGRSAVFPSGPGKSGQMKELVPATTTPLNSETAYSEPLSCHPGCKRA